MEVAKNKVTQSHNYSYTLIRRISKSAVSNKNGNLACTISKLLYRAFTCEHMHLSVQAQIVIRGIHNDGAIMYSVQMFNNFVDIL